MENRDISTLAAGRQAVDFLRLSGETAADRQSIEIAAHALFGDPAEFLSLFDVAAEMRAKPGALTRLHIDFGSIRQMAARLMTKGDFDTLARAAGGALPDECTKRLQAGQADPARRIHYIASAADQYAHDIMESIGVLTGKKGPSITVDLPEGLDIGRLSVLPFLCLLTQEDTASAR